MSCKYFVALVVMLGLTASARADEMDRERPGGPAPGAG